jgi:hypothetical protein
MPDLSPETIYRVFRDLLDEAPASLRPEIEALLARAEAGEKTDNQLLRLARRDPDFLQRVNARLEMVGGTRGFSGLPPGQPHPRLQWPPRPGQPHPRSDLRLPAVRLHPRPRRSRRGPRRMSHPSRGAHPPGAEGALRC